ncbi:MAG: AAA family ATPase [Pseudomonadota bacterium]
MSFLKSLRLDGFLSFAPGSEAVALTPLNVLIGPNASGKSNLIEAIELLHATPVAFANAIRDGGGAQEWIWKGGDPSQAATIEALIHPAQTPRIPELRYRLSFRAVALRTEVVDEAIENVAPNRPNDRDVFFYYRFQNGKPAINVRERGNGDRPRWSVRHLERQSLRPDESVLSQRKDPDLYPELTWVGQQFDRIQLFREWSFGRYAPQRRAQQTTLDPASLGPDALNLALVLNHLEHSDAGPRLNALAKRFLPRYQRFTTRIEAGSVQLYLHEEGAGAISATRLSDGTIRFLALLALLLNPEPPPLICIEEPELGLHPDALSILASLMVEASGRTQLIVTTHSDALVSALTDHASSVLVSEHLGGTRLNRVDPDKLSYWLERYRLGEIWRIGELGGNP